MHQLADAQRRSRWQRKVLISAEFVKPDGFVGRSPSSIPPRSPLWKRGDGGGVSTPPRPRPSGVAASEFKRARPYRLNAGGFDESGYMECISLLMRNGGAVGIRDHYRKLIFKHSKSFMGRSFLLIPPWWGVYTHTHPLPSGVAMSEFMVART